MDIHSVIWLMYTELHICQPMSLVSVEIAIMRTNYDGDGTYDEGRDLHRTPLGSFTQTANCS